MPNSTPEFVKGQKGVDLDSARAMINAGNAYLAPGGAFEYSRPEQRQVLPYTPDVSGYGNARITRKGARISFDMLRNVYERSSSVRPPVDFLINTLSTTPFRISVVPGARVPKRDIRRAEELFTQPLAELGMDTFRDVLGKLLRDLLVLDHSILLKHTQEDAIDAFEAQDSAKFAPIPDKSGRLKGWAYGDADPTKNAKPDFTRDEIVHFRRGQRSDSLYGLPIIETILHEVQALLNASRSFAVALNSNEIPPGILLLAGVNSPRQLDRMKDNIRQDAGIHQSYKLRVITGVQDAKWISLDRSNREMEVAQLVEQVERIVFRNFGVDRIAMGSAADVNRSTAEEMVAVRNQSLIKPILDLLADKFTYEVLSMINPGLFLEFFYYARTGDEADLVDEESSETTSARPNQVIEKGCVSCHGTGRILYSEHGDTSAAPCPVCYGRGYRGPTYVARPTGLRKPTAALISTPRRAWETMASEYEEEKLAELQERARRNIKAVLSNMHDRDSAIAATEKAREILTDLNQKAFQMGASKVRDSNFAVSRGGLESAAARVDDFVKYNLRLAIDSVKSDDAFSNIATRGVDEALSIIDNAVAVAGSAVAELASRRLG